ncbi:MAG: bifunctional metallophosphatase/5'-nucleotidase [Erysipelothrix sp.]|nr:bifunctional metallophosphatase/5'-nucleotidase [Erysipelothrix sp.]
MKKHINIILSFILIVLAFNPIQASTKDELSILFTHDMHDNFDEFTSLEGGKRHKRGGFERLLSAINKEKERDPEALLVDAGDYSMGTLYQTIYDSHSPTLRLLTRLGYDATTLGNHEFDFRTKGLTDALNTAKRYEDNPVPLIASNTKFPDTENVKDLKDAFENYGVVEDYLMIEKNNINIALIGLMGKEADSYTPTAEVVFENYIDEAKRIVKNIKDNEDYDMIVVLSHTGTHDNPKQSEDELLAKAVPELDVIISGHSHTVLEEPIIIGSTVIASAGDKANNLGTMKLSKDGSRWKLDSYEIKALTEDAYDKDTSIAPLLEEFKAAVQSEYLDTYGLTFDQVLAYSQKDFTPSNDLGDVLSEEPLGYLIADAYKYAIGLIEADGEKVDVAVTPYGVIRDSITQGDITTKDAFKVSSLGFGKDGKSGYPLISVYLSGKELKVAAEVDASIQPLQDVAQLYMSGMKYSLNTKRMIFNKVTDVSLYNNGVEEEIVDDQLYRVVANLYTGQMLGLIEDQSFGLLSVTPKDQKGNKIENLEDHIILDNHGNELKEWVALTQYLQSFEKDESGTPVIDDKYYTTHGYKEITSNGSLIERFKNPNKISLMIYGIILLLLLIIFLIIRFIIKFIKKRRNKQYT